MEGEPMLKRILSLGVKNQLAKLLDAGFSRSEAKDLLASCYEVVDTPGGEVILDHAYGSEQPFSLYPVQTAHHVFTSLDLSGARKDLRVLVRDAEDIRAKVEEQWSRLNPDLRSRLKVGFRGQVREYPLERLVKNPFAAGFHKTAGGHEVSLLPNYYRAAQAEFSVPPGFLWFLEPLLVDSANIASDYTAMSVAQHYGLPTPGLDITDELEVALWFAVKAFDANRKTFAPYDWSAMPEEQWPVVYAFSWEPGEYERINAFQELAIQPLRVLQQKCSVLWFGAEEQNGAVTRLLFRFVLQPGFTPHSRLAFGDLFPPPSRDEFYARLLDFKSEHVSNAEELRSVIEYRYE